MAVVHLIERPFVNNILSLMILLPFLFYFFHKLSVAEFLKNAVSPQFQMHVDVGVLR